MVELVRIDMITEVSVMASFIVLSRKGYLKNIFHMFTYLKIKRNVRMIFDPSYSGIDLSSYKECDWKNV